MGKPVWVIIGVIVLLVMLRVGLTLGRGVDDQTAIRQALQESIQASREGKAGGVLDKLSNKLTVNSQEVSGNSGQIADFIRKQRPDVTVTNQTAIVTGDEARITSPVDLTLNLLGQSRTIHLNDVVLVFRKEDATMYLIIPTKKWVLSEVNAPNLSPMDFFQ